MAYDAQSNHKKWMRPGGTPIFGHLHIYSIVATKKIEDGTEALSFGLDFTIVDDQLDPSYRNELTS